MTTLNVIQASYQLDIMAFIASKELYYQLVLKVLKVLMEQTVIVKQANQASACTDTITTITVIHSKSIVGRKIQNFMDTTMCQEQLLAIEESKVDMKPSYCLSVE